MDGYYYLHTNGDLIYKKFSPESDSPFVRRVWSLDTTDRKCAWLIILEALSLGADRKRIRQLSTHWGCTLEDLLEIIRRPPESTPEQRKGLRLFLDETNGVDADSWFDWLAATPQGKEPEWKTMPRNSRLDIPFLGKLNVDNPADPMNKATLP